MQVCVWYYLPTFLPTSLSTSLSATEIQNIYIFHCNALMPKFPKVQSEGEGAASYPPWKERQTITCSFQQQPEPTPSQSEELNSVWLVSLLLEGTFATYYPLESTCITYQIHLIYEAHKPILRQLENQERYSPVALFDILTEYYSGLRQCTSGTNKVDLLDVTLVCDTHG